MPSHPLDAGPASWLPPKGRMLAVLAAKGFRVPRGIVLTLRHDAQAVRPQLERLLADGPVIVRSALVGEDDARRSAAGLGISRGPCARIGEIEAAIEAIDEHRHTRWLADYRGMTEHPDDAVIIQSFIEADWIVVAATAAGRPAYAEVHPASTDALESGRSPAHAGLAAAWPHPAAAPLDRIVRDIAELTADDSAPHGVDVELVVSGDDVHVVQARPLVRPLVPGWDAFREELVHRGELDHLHGILELDAEHNPAPLSAAHAWLVGWLDGRKPRPGSSLVLCGWLYTRRRDQDRSAGEPTTTTPAEALAHLQAHAVPEARARLRRVEAMLARSRDASTILDAFDPALTAALAMVEAYDDALIPVRTASRAKDMRGDPAHPMSLRNRGAFADVLPVAWDIAAPTLAELGVVPIETMDDLVLPSDPDQVLTLLEEWDDHLFALGLAPLRRLWQAAGACLGIGDAVFHLDGDTLREALRERPGDLDETLESAAATHARARALLPPPMIHDGVPVPVTPSRWLRGIAIGSSFQGRICQRTDLEHLLAEPPPADAVVVLPALTAPAAAALAHLQLRAVCCEYGGAMSHAALMARELGLCALIGCPGCTTLPDGLPVFIDSHSGRLRPL